MKHIFIYMINFVCQEDCSQQDSSPDELVQRSADLDDLDDVDVDLEDPLADGGADDLAPVNHYVTKSLTRNSRMDIHKVGDTTISELYVNFLNQKAQN